MKVSLYLEQKPEEVIGFIEGTYFTEKKGVYRNCGLYTINNSNLVDISLDNYKVENGIVGLYSDIIDGVMKFIVHSYNDESVLLKPIQIYCIEENGKFTFY